LHDGIITQRVARAVWDIPLQKIPGSHIAGYPVKLIEKAMQPFIKPSDFVLDPFCGSGSTGVAALNMQCNFIGIDASAEYCAFARKRLSEIENNTLLKYLKK